MMSTQIGAALGTYVGECSCKTAPAPSYLLATRPSDSVNKDVGGLLRGCGQPLLVQMVQCLFIRAAARITISIDSLYSGAQSTSVSL